MIRTVVEIDEDKCDGCGHCISGCHEGALAIVDGKAKLVKDLLCDGLGACIGECPRLAIRFVRRQADPFVAPPVTDLNLLKNPNFKKPLNQWPIQLNLVPVSATFLDEADLLVCADCVPFALEKFHEKLMKGRVVVIGCPKFDQVDHYVKKLTAIFAERTIRSVTVARMEVPCCQALTRIVRQALINSSKTIPYSEEVVTTDGRQGS